GMEELGLSFASAEPSRPARDVVREYYERYEKHFGLKVWRPVEVRKIHKSDDDFVIDTDRGSIRATVVVNAAGTWRRPFRPHVPGGADFRGIQISTPEYRAAEDFAGLRVLVVGGGTSAVGFLHELEGVAAKTLWATRRPVTFSDVPEDPPRAVRHTDEAARPGAPQPSITTGTGRRASPEHPAAP